MDPIIGMLYVIIARAMLAGPAGLPIILWILDPGGGTTIIIFIHYIYITNI